MEGPGAGDAVPEPLCARGLPADGTSLFFGWKPKLHVFGFLD